MVGRRGGGGEGELGAEESELGARCGGERDRGKANVACDANRFFSQLGGVQLYLQISGGKEDGFIQELR